MKHWIVSLIIIGMLAPFAVTATGPVVLPTCVISWSANTEPDLAGYTLFVTQTSGAYGPGKPVSAPFTSMTCTVAGVDRDGQWFVTATAFDTSGNQSAKATEYPFFVQTPPPPDTTPPAVVGGIKVQ